MNKFFNIFFLALIVLPIARIQAQPVMVEGFVFAANNTGFLNEVSITALDGNQVYAGADVSDVDGKFELQLEADKFYELTCRKAGFEETKAEISTMNVEPGGTVYSKISMKRAPGYILELTLAELIDEDDLDKSVDAITNATIEIYNLTKEEESLVLRDHPSHAFTFTFEQGNSYVVMIRKKGYFTKRMEVNVAVDGCILCMEGFGTIQPGVSDNLTEGHQAGTLAANINLRKVEVGKGIRLSKIYYDLGKYDIRPDAAIELDKVVNVLKDNPHLLVEMGSHTDARGLSSRNQELSEKRARAAVDYLVGQGLERSNLTYKGYGETKLINKCGNNVDCDDNLHQQNRRTELKVIGFQNSDPLEGKSLKQIIEEEKLMEEILSLDQTIVQIPEDGLTPAGTVNSLMEEEAKFDINEPKGNVSNSLTGESEVVAIPIPENEEEFEEEAIFVPVGIETEGPEEEVHPVPEKEESIKVEASPVVYSKIKKFPSDYTGFKINLLSTSTELPTDHRIFREFGEIMLQNPEPGKFQYMIGNFKSGNAALNFLASNISERFPTATVIQYKDGKQVE